MATGYTAGIASGKITTIKEFALLCARAFGAAIDMRDDPLDAEIPEKFHVDSFHLDEVNRLEKELKEMLTLTYNQISARAQSEYESSVKYIEEYNAQEDEANARYDAMIEQVNQLKLPPTHAQFKKFMLNQLEISKSDFRVDVPIKPTPEEWYNQKVSQLQKSIETNKRYYAEAVTRNEERNEWIANLRRALMRTT